ncbi:MAG: hypothetical protein GXZ13_02380 [Synergistaceae bacterium]|nr:hypothetical protein [Synergistaceae bacterium]
MAKNKTSYKFIKDPITLFFSIIVVLFLLNATASFAVTTDAKQGEIKSLIEGIRVRQFGGNEVLLEVRGSKMSLPKVAPNTSHAITLEWSNIKFPNSTDQKDWWNDYGWDIIRITPEKTNNWWQSYDYPLIQRIQIEPKDDVDLTLNITGEKPLKIKSISGMAGSDQITIRLTVVEEVKSDSASYNPILQKTTKGVMDPLGMDTKVSLELRDVSAREVFRMLAKLRNLNLVLDTTVPDTPMTISFNQAKFSEVFAYMLRMNDLTYSIMGDTLIVGTVESIGKTMGKNKTKGYKVAFADLSKLPPIIVGLVPLSKPPVVDERTRTLYVTATPEQHSEIEAIMNKVDHPGKQVMLQARLIEVNDNAVQDVQAFLSGVYKGWLFSYGGSGLGLDYLSSNLEKKNILTSTTSTTANKIPFPGETDRTIPVNAVDRAMNALDVGLAAMESDNKGKVLANPSVVALDGRKALIKLTHNYLYQSGVDDARNPKFTKEETGPTLEITPTVGRDGFITLDLNIATGEIVGFRKTGNSETPETTKREVNTQIRVRNGELFVIGGLFQETKTKGITRVPVLSSIPLLGELFKGRNDKHVKTEMAFIVVPYILDVPTGAAEVYDMPSMSLSQ